MTAIGNYIVESDVDNWPTAISATEDIETDAIAISTERITVANDIPTGTEIVFSSTGAVPAPLVASTVYYAIRVDATTIKAATNPVNAAAGTAINLTDVGSGTHTLDIGGGSSTADRQIIIDRIEDLIERITHDYFYAKSFSIVLNGNGKNQLFLGLQSDILSVTEIKLSGVILSTNLFSFDENSIFSAALATAQCKTIEDITLSGTDAVSINITNHGFITNETVRLISVVGITPKLDGEYVVTKVDDDNFTLNGTDSSDYTGAFTSGTACFASLAELHYLMGGEYFPKGLKNIAVTGTIGWSSCPATIKRAAIIMCEAENDPTLYNRTNDFISEHLGDYSYTRGDSKYLSGITEADKLLKMYIKHKPTMGAI